ncbi:hypothetical protein [Halomonas elongata]|uniref:DUF7673 domain-containing protein n=1 Tax=Halomonas elongata (strain ATCC 33173 / DSM 2581 / NBRC 15536 / NCIMB 2198 / 1H9) TaxID=768066 RepID=E1VA20_HALED|nr:hypothetical protein [Halomonas elongata]WBF17645.1 hypothetical protein LM502_16450 [Halomonas elongata]WPU46484.1 hypothetical protein SR933_14680 [Halomonas elongata DSM 2581]CBV43908.1 uncharacterized protein HELO_4024 [Halomonas elongata DSM 2581]
MSTESRMPAVTQRLNERSRQALETHFAEETYVEERLADLHESGQSALENLVQVANRDTGQSRHCRRILLAIYNGDEWPLELHRLRCLDRDLQRAALTVIEWSAYASHELHEFLDDGDRVMQRFWKTEQGGAS